MADHDAFQDCLQNAQDWLNRSHDLLSSSSNVVGDRQKVLTAHECLLVCSYFCFLFIDCLSSVSLFFAKTL